jgi:D-xylose transport system ATP-binding protein
MNHRNQADAPVLEMKNITKKFPGVIALNDVSFHLQKNEILSLVGENGAGKSTLMKILSGLYASGTYEGEIYVNGVRQNFHSPLDAAQSDIAMIYQDINVELDMSVAENIFIGKLYRKRSGLIKWDAMRQEAERVLGDLSVVIDVNEPIRNYSASIQQLVCIARALVRNPSILILDEPTSALTESEADRLNKILHTLKTRGISSIYISHKMKEVFELADRIVVLRDGEKISEYKKDNFEAASVIEDIIGRKIENMFPDRFAKSRDQVIMEVCNLTIPHPFAPKKKIIENVDFKLFKGEILGIAGLVGSGRSELLEALFGSRHPEKGEMSLDGDPIRIKSPYTAIKNGIGFLTEERKLNGFIPTMDVKQNMTLSILRKIARYSFINKKKEIEAAKEFVDKLSIKTPSLKQTVVKLSGGNQQKTILSKWLLTNLKILFLDEPTKGIDVGAKAEIYKIMNTLTEKGISIILVSSELPELIAMCDRILILREGKFVDEFRSGDVDEQNIMHAISFG